MIWVIYKYERLQDLCFNCGVLGHEQHYCKIPRVISTYCSSIPKYDQHISTQPPRSIKAILNDHKRRYGDKTKDTAKKFFNKQENTFKATGQHETSKNKDSEEEKRAKEKAKKEWEEMIANCGEVSFVNNMGRKYKPLLDKGRGNH